MSRYEQKQGRRDGGSAHPVDWVQRQWRRYDTMVDSFTRQGGDDTARKALCLAFVRSVLDDAATERLLSEVLFTFTGQMVDDCEHVLGKERVTSAKAPLLFLMWLLPLYSWKAKTHEALRDYCCRDVTGRPTVSFRHFLGSTLRTVARYVVDPLADMIEPWL